MVKAKTSESRVLKELKIIKAEIRRLQDENKLTYLRIRTLDGKLKDEFALTREQTLEFKDEIIGEVRTLRYAQNLVSSLKLEIKAMREELAMALGQYTRNEETLEEHERRITKVEKKIIITT